MIAYIPSKVHHKLNQLTSRTYSGTSHLYFVDGSPEVSDAQIGASNAWKTVLVGALGAGGQGVFALDITDPALFTEANAASLVMWEFNDTDDPDLGHVVGQPAIRKMANGKWAAIVSGGYNNSQTGTGETVCTDSTTRTPAGCTTSSTKSAYLFIIYLNGPTGANNTWVEGTDYIKIRAAHADDATLGPNGLNQALAADINADGVVDFVYAGDLFGNLWKFDLRSTVASTWASASSQVKLFTARDPSGATQHITSKPEGTLHPTGQGFVITFGTGSWRPSIPRARRSRCSPSTACGTRTTRRPAIPSPRRR
jgi:type IV pilus assembly protein PilY1